MTDEAVDKWGWEYFVGTDDFLTRCVGEFKKDRLRLQWTQREVAEKVGIAIGTYQAIETLHRAPSSRLFGRLILLFGYELTRKARWEPRRTVVFKEDPKDE